MNYLVQITTKTLAQASNSTFYYISGRDIQKNWEALNKDIQMCYDLIKHGIFMPREEDFIKGMHNGCQNNHGYLQYITEKQLQYINSCIARACRFVKVQQQNHIERKEMLRAKKKVSKNKNRRRTKKVKDNR